MVPMTTAMVGRDFLLRSRTSMPSRIPKYRHQAFVHQSERCYYCDFLMWESNPEAFAARHKISLAQARRFQCTAEHLIARQDNGTDARQNIVAACYHCNHTRHKMNPAPNPEALRQVVIKQLKNRCWHHKTVVAKLSVVLVSPGNAP